ncbi:hypothetical protein GGS20DRAFT_583087 [Poronia punctata]|nr:hypothetical protein GGS20DRAFT_583087 [Poronia punctata]
MADKEISKEDAPPPDYDTLFGTSTLSPEDLDELNSAFSSLNVPLVADTVTEDTCLAHLKLLSTFQNLKETVGYADGLWAIYDDYKDVVLEKENKKIGEEVKEKISVLREKRWALYVARATDRYESWWNTFPTSPLTEDEMGQDSSKYTTFMATQPVAANPKFWKSDMLPPLDVLMVWHAHMLNPRVYAEDCIRHGLRDMWHAGIPWQLVNDAIDTNFIYKPSASAGATWEKTTGRKWNNEDDSDVKVPPPCPDCGQQNTVVWSTCGMRDDLSSKNPSIVGQGYGDVDFETKCTGCGKVLTKSSLEVAKFKTDMKSLIERGYPMAGTILDNATGKTSRIPPPGAQRDLFPRTFPNRLVQSHLADPMRASPAESMMDLYGMIDKIMADGGPLSGDEDVKKDKRKLPYITSAARIQLKKMLARYLGNSSPFGLELGGAVLRQGIFTEKMHNMDWLHSPTARQTITRLITKYKRFTEIMGKHPDQVAVPTLDVDLAWHTHQLSPSSYYSWMCEHTGRFVDHDDKIDENKLSSSFGWTSNIYQKEYGEVYSECTCWYCESVRTSYVTNNSLAGKFPMFKSGKQKVSDKFYETQAASCPPSNSAHISAHNSVKVTPPRRLQMLAVYHKSRLEDSWEKAKKRAAKKGLDLPRGEDSYNYWGTKNLLSYPYTAPKYYFCPLYYDTSTAVEAPGPDGTTVGAACGGIVALDPGSSTAKDLSGDLSARGTRAMLGGAAAAGLGFGMGFGGAGGIAGGGGCGGGGGGGCGGGGGS